MIGLIFVLSAVRRLSKKLSTDAQPTLFTYVNELGGYFVMGILFLICGLVAWLSGNQPPIGVP